MKINLNVCIEYLLIYCIDLLNLQVGDGTTSVVMLAGEFLKQAKPYIEENVHPQIIVRSFRKATNMVCKMCFSWFIEGLNNNRIFS